jgi:hypothetical protein
MHGGTAKADRHCRNHRRGIVVRVVIVRQRGDGSRAGGYAWISANPTDSEEMIAVRHSRASTPKWEIEDSGFKSAVPSRPSATARPNGSKEGLGTLGGRDQIRPSEKPGMSDKKLEKDTEGRGGEGRYLWSSRKQRGLCTRAFPDRGTAKPGGQTAQLRL